MNWIARRFFQALGFLIFVPLVSYFGVVVVLAVCYKQIDPPLSTLAVLRRMEGTAIRPVSFLPLHKIPLFAREGIVSLEDPNFRRHHGIDLGAIRDAYEIDKKIGHLAFGGSTITQQLARTLFLFPDKNFLRKGLEAGTALIIDFILGKDRVLELYLNSIEWGPGIFGINAAAHYWYKTDVRNLGEDQIARLEAIIVNPLRFRPYSLPERGGVLERYQALMAP